MPPIYVGSNQISSIRVGTQNIVKAYIGSTLVFNTSVAPAREDVTTPTPWTFHSPTQQWFTSTITPTDSNFVQIVYKTTAFPVANSRNKFDIWYNTDALGSRVPSRFHFSTLDDDGGLTSGVSDVAIGTNGLNTTIETVNTYTQAQFDSYTEATDTFKFNVQFTDGSFLFTPSVAPPDVPATPIPVGTSFNDAFTHLSAITSVNYVTQFVTGNSVGEPYRLHDSQGRGTFVDEFTRGDFPIGINRLRADALGSNTQLRINRSGSASITNDFLANPDYSGKSIYLVDYTNRRYVEMTVGSVFQSGGGFANWRFPASSAIPFPSTVSYSTFRTGATPSRNFFIFIGDSGYTPLV